MGRQAVVHPNHRPSREGPEIQHAGHTGPRTARRAPAFAQRVGEGQKAARSRPGPQGGDAGRAGWARVAAESWSPKEAMGSAIRHCLTHFPTVKVANFMLCVFQTQFFKSLSMHRTSAPLDSGGLGRRGQEGPCPADPHLYASQDVWSQ